MNKSAKGKRLSIKEAADYVLYWSRFMIDSGVYPVTIQRTPLRGLFRAGHYDCCIATDCPETREMVNPLDFERPIAFVKLVDFPQELLSPDGTYDTSNDRDLAKLIATLSRSRTYRLANLVETLALGAQYPELQKEFHIVGLGSCFKWHEDNTYESKKFPFLTTESTSQKRWLYWYTDSHSCDARNIKFAMVLR